MPTPTYDLIASNVLTSSASSVTFSGISGSYRDLVLVINAPITADYVWAELRFNSDSGNNYSYVTMTGNGSTASSATLSNQNYFGGGFALASNLANGSQIVQIMDYSATDKHKTGIVRNNLVQTFGGVLAAAARWANTSAINSIQILNTQSAQQYAAGTSFYLYGIVS